MSARHINVALTFTHEEQELLRLCEIDAAQCALFARDAIVARARSHLRCMIDRADQSRGKVYVKPKPKK